MARSASLARAPAADSSRATTAKIKGVSSRRANRNGGVSVIGGEAPTGNGPRPPPGAGLRVQGGGKLGVGPRGGQGVGRGARLRSAENLPLDAPPDTSRPRRQEPPQNR